MAREDNGNAGESQKLTGTIKRVIYQQNAYFVGALDDNTIVQGTMLESPTIGLELEFLGRFVEHPRYGSQFRFDSFHELIPSDSRGVARYLSTVAPWVGKVTARRIVERFGEDALRVCREEPETVAKQVPGVTPNRAQEIRDCLVNRIDREKAEVDLMGLFAGTRAAAAVVRRAFEAWGHQAASVVRANPFRLTELRGCGFALADSVAGKLGYDGRSPYRVQAGIAHVLGEAARRGDVCLPRGELVDIAVELLTIAWKPIDDQIRSMIESGKLHVQRTTSDYIYLPALWADEQYIADAISRMVSAPPPAPIDVPEDGLASDQIDAVRAMRAARVYVLTGAPGTGKTHTIRRVLDACDAAGLSVAVCAPTGKAARRAAELAGRPASTIHKLLEPKHLDDGSFEFSRDADDPLTEDVIVVDECSMLDTWLAASLLRAIQPKSRLLLVGDPYQLPSVGPGDVLAELLRSDVVPSCELTEIKRQDEAGLIVRACHAVKDGIDPYPVVAASTRDNPDLCFVRKFSPESIADAVVELVTERIPARYGFDARRDVQVICPRRDKTDLSARAISRRLQEVYFPGTPERHFAIGDRVVQCRNYYGDEGFVANGDQGFVVGSSTKHVEVEFEGATVEFPRADNDLELAYALTVHKFQGSEAPAVVIPIHASAGPFLLRRKLIYTALSRARDICIVVGDRGEIAKAVQRCSEEARYTLLSQLLWLGVDS